MGMITGAVALAVMGIIFARVAQGPIGHAIGRRIQGRHPDPEPQLRAEVEELREYAGQLQQRLLDVEERLDFAERLLAQRKEPDRLPG